jgi:hypothetical protein
MARQVPQTRLVVLSSDDHVIDVVRNTAQPGASVVCARDLQHLLQSSPGDEPDVLIIDGLKVDVTARIERLAQRFPNTQAIVVGTRDESDELMQLAASGQIFRFLLRPLSAGPVRLAVAAAVARHGERKEFGRGAGAPAADKRPQKYLVTLGALGVALFLAIGGLWAATTFLTPKAETAPLAPVVSVPVAASKPDSMQAELEQAAQALAQGQSLNPGGALDQYRSILALEATNSAALAGIRTIANQQLERAEAALLQEDLDEAERAIALVREVDVDHPRLGFLDTQLTRERERRDLREQRVRRLVEGAQVDIESGNLLGLVSGGAVDALLEAREIDPDDKGVARGIRDLTAALAEALRKSLSTGDMQRAQGYAAAARKLGTIREVLAAAGLPRNAFSTRSGRGRSGGSNLEQSGGRAGATADSESN